MSNVYEKAYNKWGEDAQLLKLIEELDELRQAVCDYQEYQFNLPTATKLGTPFIKTLADPEKLIDHIIEEAVDVNIMTRQLKIIFPNRQTQWRYYHNFKLYRLAERIKSLSVGNEEGDADIESAFKDIAEGRTKTFTDTDALFKDLDEPEKKAS